MRTSTRGRAASRFRYSPLVAALACALAPQAAEAVTYVVTNTTDSVGTATCLGGVGDECSLRQAITLAVGNCGLDGAPTITFAIPGTGPFTIAPSSAFPPIGCASGPFNPTIDGYTQPGSSPNSATAGFNANLMIRIQQGPIYAGINCGIESANFGYGGILTLRGVELANFTYGGFLPALCGPVKLGGSRIVGNAQGVRADEGSLIGGSTPGDRNVFVGNLNSGIYAPGGNLVVRNNLIGTPDGTSANGNGTGIELLCAPNSTIEGNVISGNLGDGISGDLDNTLVANNKIGVAANGVSALPNGGNGVGINQFECGSLASLLQNNVIAHNGGHGVTVTDGIGHTITNSSIHSNGGKNIDLDFVGGPMPNDTGDIDTGPNNRQNHPVISLVTQSGGNTFVSWSLDSQPATHTVEFFSNTAATAPAGRTPLPLPAAELTDASGNFSKTTMIEGLHDFIAATATNDGTGDTSEFSAVVAVTPTPGASFSPTQLGFGGVPTGGTSASQTATLTSTGGAPYVINLIESGGTCYGGPPAPPAMCSDAEFTCSTTCAPATPYNNGQSCTFTASFSPSFLGFQSTTIYVCDNAAGSPRTLTLSGFGVAPPPLQLSPTQHDFGSVLVGASSRAHLFRVSNPGTGPQTISGISTSPQFPIASNNCPAEVPPGSSCDVEVVFAPSAAGSAFGSLVVTVQQDVLTDASSAKALLGTTTVSSSLSGRGIVASQGTLSMPPSVDVGTYTIGSPPLEAVVDLSNTGSAPIDLTTISVTGPFTLTNECGPTLAAGATCRLRIGFSATTLGDFSGTLSVVTSATGGSRAVPVTARAQASPLPLVRVSPAEISFGERMAGTLSGAQRIVINNVGGAPASITTMLTGTHFQVTGTNCGPVLAAQAECFADVAFIPSAFGTRIAQFIVGSNSAGSPHTVTLNGVGCRPFFPSAQRGSAGSGPNCAP